MATNTTYLLGAGASCNRLPIISNLSERILLFRDILKSPRLGLSLRGQPNFNQQSFRSFKNDLVTDLEWIASEGKKHNTVDTYAKKLFLQGKNIELHRLKVALSICFFYWQFHDGRGGDDSNPNIDPRYISLMSAFLTKKNNEIILPEHVNIITWNYDVQPELALQYFLEDEKYVSTVQNKFKSYPNSNGEQATGMHQIVHLNGIAGLIQSGPHTGFLFDDLHCQYRDFDKMLIQIMSFYTSCIYNISGEKTAHINHTFSFAWEENPISKKSVEHAVNIMKTTTHVIIIGYSFPVFNREIDRKLFQGRRNLQKIYYQDPNPDAKAFSETFGITTGVVQELTKTDQFFLPIEF